MASGWKKSAQEVYRGEWWRLVVVESLWWKNRV